MSLRAITLFLTVLTLAVTARDSRSQPSPQSPSQFSEDVSTREGILQSSRWRQAQRQFNEWLSVQKIYTPAQAAQLRRNLELKIASMSAAELGDFLAEMEDKLQVLLSPEASDARSWMGFLSDRAQKELIQRKTGGGASFASMTATQMREALQSFRMQRQSRAESQQAFNQVNTRRIEMQRADEQARQQSAERARDRAAWSAAQRPSPYGYQSPYGIRRFPSPLDREPYYRTPWGRWGRYDNWLP